MTLEFEVTPGGRIRKLRTVHSHPPKMMEFQIRRSMRQAVFRPHLLDGVPQTVVGHTYTYEFPYFPSRTVTPPARQRAQDGADEDDRDGDDAEVTVES